MLLIRCRRRASVVFYAAWLTTGAVAAACGSTSRNDLFGGAGNASSDGGSSGGDGTTSVDGREDAGTGDGGGGETDGGGGATDAPAPTDPGAFCGKGGNGSPVFCDPKQSQFCCVTVSVTTTYQCVASGGLCGPTSTRVSCDDTADCPGQVCCGNYDTSAGRFTTVRCQSACGSGGTTVGVRMCDPNDNDCPNGRQCVPSQKLPGYHNCQT